MLMRQFREKGKKWFYKCRSFLIAKVSKGLMRVLLFTCRFEVEGLERFHRLATSEKCILMLWHNRLPVVPSILYRFCKQFNFAAVISASRDGDLLSMIVHSYKQGRTIRVPHNARHQALRDLIQQVNARQHIVVITPDGPRGPRYELKPGIAVAALETQANVVALNWESSRCWELKTWDRLRLPKPFSTIKVAFEAPVQFSGEKPPTLEEAKSILYKMLP